MSNTNCNNTITFRSKFQKLIKCDVEHEVFQGAFRKFLDFDEDTAFDMLWRMESIPGTQIFEKIGLYDGLSPELVSTLKSELRHQYETLRSKLTAEPLTGCSEEVQKAYNVLKGRTNSIVATVVYQHCISALYLGENEVSRILYLLDCKIDQKFYGGLKALQFECWEAEYLKPHHYLVYDLMKAIFDEFVSQPTEMEDTPFASLANTAHFVEQPEFERPFVFNEAFENQEAQKEPTDKVEVETAHQDIPDFKAETYADHANAQEYKQTFTPITPENVLIHKDAFSAFVIQHDFACLSIISNLGYDLNQILAKEKAILNFIKAAEAL